MPPKNPRRNPTGLGRAIINQKTKDARQARESDNYSVDVDSTTRLKSVTQEQDLDEFLNTAQLAGTDFTAERRNVKVIQTAVAGSTHNPYLLTDQEEKNTLRKHGENKERLRVPRRPPWTKSMPVVQLDRQEKDAFLEWRRGLADLQDRDKFLLTPFERNLEVWRQLWRVLERSHLVVQIVDARNPLRFRCEDLEKYVKDVEGSEGEQGTGKDKRRCLLLINKADLLTAKQRRIWADYFDKQGIQYAFFSAAHATALQQARREALFVVEQDTRGNENEEFPSEADDRLDDSEPEDENESFSEDSDDGVYEDPLDALVHEDDYSDESSEEGVYFSAEEDSPDGQDPRTKVLTVLELEEFFVKSAPDLSTFADTLGNPAEKLVVGLVGYPNVGKSSTINSLLGEKKVSVSSTPGKTKHFQTIHLSPTMVLCDCPGLVFPQFATTKADLVCDGVLPIDQLREHTGPVTLLVKRTPRAILEAVYGLSIRTRGLDEGGDSKVTAEDFLIAYAVARGYTRAGQGNPDEARAARYVLKDFVNGKLLFCHPPPGVREDMFNEETWELTLKRASGKKRAPTTRVTKGADTFVPSNTPDVADGRAPQGTKSQAVDKDFFANNSTLSSRPFVQGSSRHGQEFSRARIFPHQNTLADDGTRLGGRRARIATVLASAGGEVHGKKHHKKGKKRIKQRSGKGYDI